MASAPKGTVIAELEIKEATGFALSMLAIVQDEGRAFRSEKFTADKCASEFLEAAVMDAFEDAFGISVGEAFVRFKKARKSCARARFGSLLPRACSGAAEKGK